VHFQNAGMLLVQVLILLHFSFILAYPVSHVRGWHLCLPYRFFKK